MILIFIFPMLIIMHLEIHNKGDRLENMSINTNIKSKTILLNLFVRPSTKKRNEGRRKRKKKFDGRNIHIPIPTTV